MSNKKKIIIIVLITLFLYFVYSINSKREIIDYDIVIVGSGLAGLSAAIQSFIISKGKSKILVLESEGKYGGNSRKATSGINLISSFYQIKNNINDSLELFLNDTMIASKNLSNINLVKVLAEDCKEIENFYKLLSIDLPHVRILGGHTVPRTHFPNDLPIGIKLTTSLYNLLIHDSNVFFKFNSTVMELIYDKKHNKIKGIKYLSNNKQATIISKVVILTCGGYAHDYSNNSLLKEFAPNLVNFPTTNGYGSRGIGVKIGRQIGAELVGMEYVQVHPTGFVDMKNRFEKHKFLAPELLRGVGGILVNHKGQRFANELGTRDYLTKLIMENCKVQKNEEIEQYEGFIILNKKSVNDFGDNINFYIGKGLLNKYNNFTEFANKFNINDIELNRTINEYNECKKKINEDKFNKTIFPVKFNYTDIIYVGVITPSIHYTMGGLKINSKAEIINIKNESIKGLYGAGEVTGGVHGGNRLGGNSLLECAVFGRRAANSAYFYIIGENSNKK